MMMLAEISKTDIIVTLLFVAVIAYVLFFDLRKKDQDTNDQESDDGDYYS